MRKYSESNFEYKRRLTREVMIGNIGVGGKFPIRVQSMTTTPTMDTLKTVDQIERLIQVGCEIVRVTAQGPKEAGNLRNIKLEMKKRGLSVPLVADIHFNPRAALEAANHVEKVRINPGNFADTKTFNVKEYSDKEYALEIERIEEKFCPLVQKLKSNGVALRIGTNHGSLSDRIMNRYGDTPEGMVESALEFARICEDNQFYEIIFSMKASNPQVMIQAYRLLCARMYELKMNYPLHLGVTEAGEGEDGRVKSALGIGSLLEDGLGDTIRVSLTEEPEAEVPVAFKLVEKFAEISSNDKPFTIEEDRDPYSYEKLETENVQGFWYKEAPKVILTIPEDQVINTKLCDQMGYFKSDPDSHCLEKKDIAADWIFISRNILDEEEMNLICSLKEAGCKILSEHPSSDLQPGIPSRNKLEFTDTALQILLEDWQELDPKPLINKNNVFILESRAENFVGLARKFIQNLRDNKSLDPVILKISNQKKDLERFYLEAAWNLGGLLLDGIGNGVWVECSDSLETICRFQFTLLQATRLRVTKTEYISCPSCGRTLFDLQTTTERIRNKTGHLKGVKIAVMGCIVNGPGEMADADFGYVGAAPGKVNLFVGKELVERGVEEKVADEKLIELIKLNGKWVDFELLENL